MAAFFRKADHANTDLLSNYAWYVPGIGGMFLMLGLLLLGALLGSLLVGAVAMATGLRASGDWSTLLSYPVMFIPPMLAAGNISMRNAVFENGYKLDSRHFGRLGGAIVALLCMAATFALAFCMDAVNALMPPMPEWLEGALKQMTQGDIWINLLCVSIFAPFFEEWLCRGIVLRGLLNYKRTDAEGNAVRGLKPWVAIVISALFFAAIHLNPWQAIPAFALGCLFGWVYYKTGSLKLTMLMHCTNNTLAVLMSRVEGWENAENWTDIMSKTAYGILFGVAILFLAYFYLEVNKIQTATPQGNCDEITGSGE